MNAEDAIRNRAFDYWERAGRPPGDGTEFWLRAEAEVRYLTAIAHLPTPSFAQTANFAAHALEAHSWYKHVPRLPAGTRVVAFLDPDAGTQLVTTPAGEEVRPILSADECWHYSMVPTAEYLRRFGHWTYCGVRPTGDDPPRYRTPDGRWSLLPAEVCEQSGCPAWYLLSDPPGVVHAFLAGRLWFAQVRDGLPTVLPDDRPSHPGAERVGDQFAE